MSEVFYYSVVKFVPHPVRDETLNIGVVLVSKTGNYSDYLFTKTYKSKLRVIAPDVHAGGVQRFVEDFQARFPRLTPEQSLFPGEGTRLSATLGDLSRHEDSRARFSPLREVQVDHPDEALRSLFREFVGPLKFSGETVTDKPAIRANLRRMLRQLVPRKAIVENPRIAVRHGYNTLDLGIRRTTSGKRELALALEPIAFSIGNSDEIVRQRDHVAWVAYDAEGANGEVVIGVVVSDPTERNEDLYRQSLQIFRDTRVEVVAYRQPEGLHELLKRAHVF